MAAGGKQPSHRKRGRHHGGDDDDDGEALSSSILTTETGLCGFDFVVLSLGFGIFSIEIFTLALAGGHGRDAARRP